MSSQRIAPVARPPNEVSQLRKRPRRAPRRPFLPRVVLLLVGLVALDLWAVHHLGMGLSEPRWLGFLVASFTAVTALVDHLIGKKEKVRLAGRLVRLGRLLLATPFLIMLYLSLAIAALTYSSVLVVSSEGEAVEKVRLQPLEGKSTTWRFGDPEEGPEHLLVYSGPFGQPFRLEVPDYLPAVLHVPALTGVRVVPERDLRRPPTILLRPPMTALGALEDPGAALQIQVRGGQRTRRYSVPCPCRQSSYLIGRSQRMPPAELLADWRLELLAAGYMDEDSQLWETLFAWKTPHGLRVDLAPGMRVRAEVLSGGQKVVASVEIVVGEEDFQDVLMIKE